ncbi:thioredoxin domain-containing protein [Sphingomonas sp. KRR8]|uniref:DsbA family protein n=1 Tax=Sphingomonas sp. KRR8 TaxID=2942996 RepID=UPI0020202179|nr:DsbA family protein [Sphingomonas sp. KRR8]URD61103.1 thioredoxin domain-containing protein [Sphingomonas sp. KRR8]
MARSLTRREAISLSGLTVVGGAASVALQRSAPLARDVRASAAARTILEDDNWPVYGPDNADLTVVCFTDYQCPACRFAEPKLAEAIENDGKTRIIYRDWPIFGSRSIEAARAALAATYQGRYLPIHQALMKSTAALTSEEVIEIAQTAGLNATNLRKDLVTHGPEISRRIEQTNLDASWLHLPGTPGYLIGGLLLVGAHATAEFSQVFASARHL